MAKKTAKKIEYAPHSSILQHQAGNKVAESNTQYCFPIGGYGTDSARNPDTARPIKGNRPELTSANWNRPDPKATGVFIKSQDASTQISVLAIGDGVIARIDNNNDSNLFFSKGDYVLVLKLDKPIKVNGKTRPYVYYAGINRTELLIAGGPLLGSPRVGERVSRSEKIASIGRPLSGVGHGLYIGLGVDEKGEPRPGHQNTSDALYNAMSTFLNSVDVTTGFIPATGAGYSAPTDFASPGTSDENSLNNPGSIATAAAFSSYFQMPGLMEQREAASLTGQRSLLNDKPLFPFVEQIAAGSLRNFMSMPNGDFYAFYPDYFGGLGRTAYWKIKDIEVISGKIDLSDDSLATHVFVVGDTIGSGGELGFGTVDFLDRIHTAGVVNVLNAFAADFLNGPPSDANPDRVGTARPSLAKKDQAISFLKKYGARPYYEEAPAVRSPIYETFLAYQRFCLLWAAQFKTEFQFTFMPELFPGGLVEFEDHGLQCYIDQVVHGGSYESGFTTTATLSAPSAVKDSNGKPVDPDKSWVHAGMIRAFQFDASDSIAHPKDAYDSKSQIPKPAKKKGN